MIDIDLKKYNIDNEKYIIIGVSSGPDSMALLHLLQKKIKSKIICTHINHNIRKESNDEENYLKKYCQENNIIFEAYKIKEYKEKNFENEARKQRYSFYEKILKKYDSHTLFLAHHGDDLIETVLMKISRGSNIEGYAGIKEISQCKNKNNYPYIIIRPLLLYNKEDIIQYNKKNNIKYYIDSSNKSDNYTRNRYRNHVLPFLKEENKDINKQFYKYSQTLLEYNNYITNQVTIIKEKIYINNSIQIKNFIKLNTFIQKILLYKILEELYNNENNIIKEEHIKNIIALINNIKPNISINLPHNIKVTKAYNTIYFNINNTTKKDYIYEFNTVITIDNHIIKKIDYCEENGNDICRINSKNIKLPLHIRNKKTGDTIEVMGLNGKKKIKDIFIEKKLTYKERYSYPLLVDNNDNILWIPNIKKSKFNEKKDGNYDIILKYCEKERKNEY